MTTVHREGPTRVLMVEDDEMDELLLRRKIAVAMPEAQVQVVRRVRDACSILDRGQADLALVDWRLPDGDGGVVVAHAMELDTPIPVILMTNGDPEDACGAIRQGAQDFIPKDELTAKRLAMCLRFAFDRIEAQSKALDEARTLAAQALSTAAEARRKADQAEAGAAVRMAGNLAQTFDHLSHDLKSAASAALPVEQTPGNPLVTRLAYLGRQAAASRDRLRSFTGEVPLSLALVSLVGVVDQAARLVGIPCHRGPAGRRVHSSQLRVRGDQVWLGRALRDLFAWVRAMGQAREPVMDDIPALQATGREWIVDPIGTDHVSVRVAWAGAPPPRDRARYEPFQRTTLPGPDIATALGVIRAHEGGVGITATHEGGVLDLWLPKGGPSQGRGFSQSATSHLRTLVVAGRPSDGEALRTALERFGHDVSVFPDGATAWEAVSRGPRPELVVADVQDPTTGSVELVRSMDAAMMQVPVVYYTRELLDPRQTLPWRQSNRLLTLPMPAEALQDACLAVLAEARAMQANAPASLLE